MSNEASMYDFKIAQHANEIMIMYRQYDEKAYGHPLLFSIEKDICVKCLESMKCYGLIANYDTENYIVMIVE